MKLTTILRTHDGSSVHGENRFLEATKTEIVRRCVRSLFHSLEAVKDKSSLSLIVVDDHSTPETVNWIKDQVVGREYKTLFVDMAESGNGESMKNCYEFGLQTEGDVLYLVEDDYLHKKEAVQTMITDFTVFTKKLGGKPIVLAPYDDPLDYLPDRVVPTRIVAGSDRHWRQNTHTTYTMMMPKWVLLHFWDKFMAMTQYGKGISEDNTINLIYRQFEIILFSPMPGLATHLCNIPPAVGDWKKDWEGLAGA